MNSLTKGLIIGGVALGIIFTVGLVAYAHKERIVLYGLKSRI
ncbi:hypothetical protein [Nitrosopumilus spindle-shaped virus]|uniref:Uncharacterized protein n=1 Tax=Nitrosopumilus spindle-shaped virus TaxID=2508184 RepID=A0A514K348_9VIRU|nr:hypothetical protein [Nitrosopumilus spindle-shaped virus]